MSGYRISEVAERTGFSAPTLRYYEDIGLVHPPERSAAGYRRYDDQAVDRLRFIARSKRLGLTLEEITGLVALLDAEECAPVQAHLRDLLVARQRAAVDQIGELDRFVSELARVGDRLGLPAAPGACSDTCGCNADDHTDTVARVAPVAVACTLDPSEAPERLAQWQDLAEHVVERAETADGIRVRFDERVPAAEVAALAAKEQHCCSFLGFRIEIDGAGTSLEIVAPPEARSLVERFFVTAR